MKIFVSLSDYNDMKEVEGFVRSILLSYYYIGLNKRSLELVVKEKKWCRRAFLDSGAFSGVTLGVAVDIKKYISFLKSFGNLFFAYSNLDKIGDPKRSEYNLKMIEDQGLKPLPVFHLGSDYRILEKMIRKYKYICLGGLVKYSKQREILSNHLNRCFSMIAGSGIKIHLFGQSSKWILEKYPAYSCDSTSAFHGQKSGTIFDFVKEKTYIRGARMDKENLNPIYLSLTNRKGYNAWRERTRFNIQSLNRLEDYITALWRERGIIYEEE